MEMIIAFLPIVICLLGYLAYQEWKDYLSRKAKKIIKKLTDKKPVRERLKVMYKFETDKAVYIAYNTETIQGHDCVNIEIERQVAGKTNIILEKEIFEDSWGSMGGDSFYTQMRRSRAHLIDYIKEKGEFTLNEINY